MEAELQREGWSFSDKGLEYFKTLCGNKDPSKKDTINNALNTDIRQIGKQSLPADINRAKDCELQGPMVLQIQKVRNVSAPNAKEDSSFAPRMLKVTLTDGVVHCTGIELETVNSLSLMTPPGSKVCLLGRIAVQHGFILLNDGNLKFLGGDVEHLKSKWEISKNVNKLQRKVLTAEGGPPLFVPFEDSDFARRKPSALSMTVKIVDQKQSQKVKASSAQVDKISKPFEEKKIWKSGSLKAKKDKTETTSDQSDVRQGWSENDERKGNIQKGRSMDKAKNEGKYQQSESRQNDSRHSGTGREKRERKEVFQKDKKEYNKDIHKEDKKHPKRHDEEFQTSAKQEFAKNARVTGKKTGGGTNFGETKLWSKNDREVPRKHETAKPKSGSREDKVANHSRKDLPPRLERLKQGQNSDMEEGKNMYQQDKKFLKKQVVQENDKPVERKKRGPEIPGDKDMEKVLDLINEKMRIDQGEGGSKDDGRRKTTGYENKRYSDQSRTRAESNDTATVNGKVTREKYARTDAARNEQRKDNRWGQKWQDHGGQRWQDKKRQDREEDGDSYRRNGRYNSGEQQRNYIAAKEESGAYQESRGYQEKRSKETGADSISELDYARGIQDGALQDNGWKNENSGPEDKAGNEREQSDKVAQFMSAVVANSGQQAKGDFMMNMQGHVFTDQSIAQANVPQPMITSSGSIMYNYVPTYPTTMFQQTPNQQYQNVNQRYQTPNQPYRTPNPTYQTTNQTYQAMQSQEFQGHGYQAAMQSVPRMTRYQQAPPMSTLYYQNVGPPNMNFPNQRMQPPGFAPRVRPRVKHDIYRPKTD